MTDLLNQTILVTGAAGRLGTAFSQRIVASGGQVLLTDINQSSGIRLAKELIGERAHFFEADITTLEGIQQSVQACLSRFGRLDAVVHAAYPRSDGWGTHFEQLQPEYLYEDLNKQLGGAILLSQNALKHFVQQGYGHLIHISSIQGIGAPKFEHYEGTTMTSPIEYSAIKSGMIAITRWLAKHYRQQNIRVNCISLGGIIDQQPESFLKRYQTSCNSKGMLDPEDICGALIFLLSEQSQFVTGQNLVIDDGWSL